MATWLQLLTEASNLANTELPGPTIVSPYHTIPPHHSPGAGRADVSVPLARCQAPVEGVTGGRVRVVARTRAGQGGGKAGGRQQQQEGKEGHPGGLAVKWMHLA